MRGTGGRRFERRAVGCGFRPFVVAAYQSRGADEFAAAVRDRGEFTRVSEEARTPVGPSKGV